MKSFGDDLLNTDKVIAEVEELTRTVVDANAESTRQIQQTISFKHADVLNILEYMRRVEEKQHRFRLLVMSSLGLNLLGLIGVVVKLYFLPLL